MGVNNIYIKDNKYYIKHLETDIVRRCNLNCKGCYHFAPLFKNDSWQIDFDKWREALKNISERFVINTFGILGGEPLLHPRWFDFIQTARELLPESRIQLWTNGTKRKELEDRMSELTDMNIEVIISEYPIINKVEQASKRLNKFYLDNLSLDLKGEQNSYESWLKCGSKNCIQLTDKYLYKCMFAYGLNKFNDTFNLNLPYSQDDIRIDLYNSTNEEIYNWLKKLICVNFVIEKQKINLKLNGIKVS